MVLTQALAISWRQLETPRQALEAEEPVDGAQIGLGVAFTGVDSFHKISPAVAPTDQRRHAAIVTPDGIQGGGTVGLQQPAVVFLELRRSASRYFALNRYTVVLFNVCPGLRMVLGKEGWLGESG